jgi:uncharacterized Zn finger protein (UPF0148 family)
MRMLKTVPLQRCRHCGGPMLRDADGDIRCLHCGREGVRTVENEAAQDWTQVAIAQLRETIREVEDLDGKRQAAERIVKALVAAEVRSIPELPWRRAKGNGAHPVRVRSLPSCARCGRSFTTGPQYTKQDDGTAVCRHGCRPVVEAVS